MADINPRVSDISHWQLDEIGEYDFNAARKWGIWGVIAKSTEGTDYIDPTYKTAREGARKAGLLFGTYHFFRPGKVDAQVDHFLKVAWEDDPERDALLLCLDHEDEGCSVEDVKQFMKKVEEITGQCPVLYSGHLIKDQLGNKEDAYLGGSRLWLAQYGTSPEVQISWEDYWLWQFTGDGNGPEPHDIPGIGKNVDINSWAGSEEELEGEWAEGAKRPPGPQPPVEPAGDGPPPWLHAMRAITGTQETPGSADNPRIMFMADYVGARWPEQKEYADLYTGDDVAWCGLTMAFVMSVADIRPVFGETDTDRWMWALAWSEWPDADRLNEPVLGCVVVTEREGGGHVTLFEEYGDPGYLRCRGGNQSDMVNVASIAINSVVAYMWPKGVRRPSFQPDVENQTKWLQSSLNIVVPQLEPKLVVDGDAGPATIDAVKQFQIKEGLMPNGVPDSRTVGEIIKSLEAWNLVRPE